MKEGAEDVPVGSPVCIVVDEASEIAAAQAAPAPTASPSKPAPAPTPVPATPAAAPIAAPAPQVVSPVVVVAPAPVVVAPAPAAKPASPAVSATSATGGEYLAFERWGLSLTRASMGAGIARAQRSYVDVFGYTGHDPLPVVDEAKTAKAPKA